MIFILDLAAVCVYFVSDVVIGLVEAKFQFVAMILQLELTEAKDPLQAVNLQIITYLDEFFDDTEV